MIENDTALPAKELKTLADQLIDFLLKNELFDDVIIYTCGKRYMSPDYGRGGNAERIEYVTRNGRDTDLYIEDAVASSYLSFANDETLSMAFEGALYDALNYGDGNIEDQMRRIFEKHNLYFEYGDAWNLTCYVE